MSRVRDGECVHTLNSRPYPATKTEPSPEEKKDAEKKAKAEAEAQARDAAEWLGKLRGNCPRSMRCCIKPAD